eukprot:140068-Chlamydomonas_euryale.AAC.8
MYNLGRLELHGLRAQRQCGRHPRVCDVCGRAWVSKASSVERRRSVQPCTLHVLCRRGRPSCVQQPRNTT